MTNDLAAVDRHEGDRQSVVSSQMIDNLGLGAASVLRIEEGHSDHGANSRSVAGTFRANDHDLMISSVEVRNHRAKIKTFA